MAAQIDISLWRNQDQNENQCSHEIEIIQTIAATAAELSTKEKKVLISDLVNRSLRRTPVKISQTAASTLAKFYTQFLVAGSKDLVDELVHFHSMKVNPREVIVSMGFFSLVSGDEVFAKCPHLRMYLVMSQYCTEKLSSRAGGSPSSNFIEAPLIQNLAKKGSAFLEDIEKQLIIMREKYVPLLESIAGLPRSQALLELQVFVDLFIRTLLAKPLPCHVVAVINSLPKKIALSGKFSQVRIKDLGCVWATLVEKQYIDSNFSKSSGLVFENVAERDEEVVGLENLRTLKKNNSDESEVLDAIGKNKFKRGDIVTVWKRMTWKIPVNGNPDYRKDIVKGTQGTIAGWADSENKQVLVEVQLDLPDGPRQVTYACAPKNLLQTKDFEAIASEEAAEIEQPAAEDSGSSASVPEWALGTSQAQDVTIQEQLGQMSEFDALVRTFWLKSRIGVALQAIAESLPTYSDQDLVIVKRLNCKGVPRAELWTKRAFDPYTLVLAPISSAIKDTHLMNSANCTIGLPKHGWGAHPEGKALALDGRMRASTDDDVRGALFWIVSRTSEASSANMVHEPIATKVDLSFQMPGKRRKTAVAWSPSEMPCLPVLVNTKAIKKHTMLSVFVPPVSTDNKGASASAGGPASESQ